MQIQAHAAVRVAIDVEYGSDVDLAVVPVITPQQLRHRRVGDPSEQRLPGDPDLYPLLDLHIGHPELVGWDASWPGEPGRCAPLVHKNIGSGRAFCGLVIRPGQAELVTVSTGMPCVACVVAAPDPEPT